MKNVAKMLDKHRLSALINMTANNPGQSKVSGSVQPSQACQFAMLDLVGQKIQELLTKEHFPKHFNTYRGHMPNACHTYQIKSA